MKICCKLITLIVFVVSSPMTIAEIKSTVIDYTIDGKPFQGYLSYDDKLTGKRPGVIVVHEWWGHNNYARKRAEMLAELGYTAFALDMYGKGKLADHPDNAQAYMQSVMSNMGVMEQRFNQAWTLLKQQPTVDLDKIAAIGYCFGGAVVLHMAKNGADLAGVVSFHGSLSEKLQPKPNTVKASVLVLNGADDPFITAEQINNFKQTMKAANADFRFINYPGAKHSFTNPGADKFGQQFNMPLEYNEAVDKQSWEEMQGYFSKIFK
ncbi:MAG: dienelactone hydrolase family protein [Gammaproteobacteria bacterium]|nr:dienelactone hydrolase family protein [Gammaproteobacteria bacterium]